MNTITELVLYMIWGLTLAFGMLGIGIGIMIAFTEGAEQGFAVIGIGIALIAASAPYAVAIRVFEYVTRK